MRKNFSSKFHDFHQFISRQSSVDFINSIIEKNKLQQDKVKLVFVVHPGGKKFMSLILDLISLAIAEVMKRKNFEAGKSIDLDETTEMVTKMGEKEKSFLAAVENETKKFKEIADKIEKLIVEKILPANLPATMLDDFMSEWNKVNNERFNETLKAQKKSSETFKKGVKFCESVKKVLSMKSSENLKSQNEISLPQLLHQVNKILPALIDYKNKWTLNVSREEEMKIEEQQEFVNKMLKSFEKINIDLHELREYMKNEFDPFIQKVTELKIEAQMKAREEESDEMAAIRAQRDRRDQELLEMLRAPKYQLNIGQVPSEAVINTRISLMEDSEARDRFSNSPFYQVPKAGMIRRAANSSRSSKTSASFNESIKPPIFKSINTRDLLDRATSRLQSNRLNATSRVNPLIPRIKLGTTPKLSSTLLSATHFENGLFNCTGVSLISSSSPHVESPETEHTTAIEVKQKDQIVETPMISADELKISPRRQLTKQFDKVERESLISEVTLTGSTASDENKENIKNKTNEITTDFTFAAYELKNDEDLFDVSDSVLQDLE